MIGEVVKISRLRMASDGEGISTLVGFFGCPLNCRFCINKECSCDNIIIDNPLRCAYTPEELAEVIEKDRIYHIMTGGGTVFGGGEPLSQAKFIHKVCLLLGGGAAKRVETSMFVEWASVEMLIDDIDEWIIDIKTTDPEIYLKYTGERSDKALENIRKLACRIPKERILVRVPHIPGYTGEKDIAETVKWVKEQGIDRIDEFEYYIPAGPVKDDKIYMMGDLLPY